MATVLYVIERSAGIIGMSIAWFIVGLPALKFGINSKTETITTATTKNESVRRVINCGLVIGAIFQASFILYLTRRFSFPLLSFGSMLYIATYLATIGVAFFAKNKHPKMHVFMAYCCFLFGAFSLLFIGFSIKSLNFNLFLISIIAPIVYFIGEICLWAKYRFGNALMELWGFAILSIWTVIMTFG